MNHSIMTFRCLLCLLMAGIGSQLYSASIFTNSQGDQNFNDPANWTNGLPQPSQNGDDYDLVIKNGLTASTTASFGAGDQPDIDIIIGLDGTIGTLIVNAGHEVYKGNSGEDIQIGVGANSVGYAEIYGTLDARGGGSFIFIGDQYGGQGFVNVYDGGWLNSIKGAEVINGKLTWYPDAVATAPKDIMAVHSNGTVAFVISGSKVATLTNGDPDGYPLYLGQNSILEITLAGNYQFGDSWILFSGINDIINLDGGGPASFGQIVNTQGHTFDIEYQAQSVSGAADGYIKITLIPTTPLAINPQPADTSQDIDPFTALSWQTVNTVNATFDINIGTDSACSDVLLGAVTGSETSYAPSNELLNYDTLYYWRIDIHQNGQEYPGPVWSFRTQRIPEYQLIEDFHSYIDNESLMTTWDDGSSNGSNSQIQLSIYGSIRLDYDNQSAPYRSETTCQFESPRDWLHTPMKAVSLLMLGHPNNDNEPIYITLEDLSQTVTVNVFDISVNRDEWQTCELPLASFTQAGLDLAHVTAMAVGIGTGQSPGGTGQVYFDDITLYPRRCLAQHRVAVDLNQDCQIDMLDLEMLISDWLLADYQVQSMAPSSSGLQAWYRFNEITGDVAHDSSLNARHADIIPGTMASHWQTGGVDGNGCVLLENNCEIQLPVTVFEGIESDFTLSFWIKGLADDYPESVEQVSAYVGPVPATNSLYNWDTVNWLLPDVSAYGPDWNHYTLVKDTQSGELAIYHHGILVARNSDATLTLDGVAGITTIGLDGKDTQVWLDDLRLYNRVLNHSEIVGLAYPDGGSVNQPIVPVYTQSDIDNNGHVNLPDFIDMMEHWLSTQLWP